MLFGNVHDSGAFVRITDPREPGGPSWVRLKHKDGSSVLRPIVLSLNLRLHETEPGQAWPIMSSLSNSLVAPFVQLPGYMVAPDVEALQSVMLLVPEWQELHVSWP